MRRFSLILLALVGACCTPRLPVSPPVPVAPQSAPTPEELGMKEWYMPVLFETINTLGQKVPLTLPLRVHVQPLPGKWGESCFDPSTMNFDIWLSPMPADPDFLRGIVMHEWAHCMTQCQCEDPHCSHWGINLAICYRAIYNPDAAPVTPDAGAEQPEEPEED